MKIIGFADYLKNHFTPSRMSRGEISHIISKMTTQRTEKGKKDHLYSKKNNKKKFTDLLDN